MRLLTIAMLSCMFLMATPAQADGGLASTPLPWPDQFAAVPDRFSITFGGAWISCTTDLGTGYCIICVGPGRTEFLPVEPQDGGIAVGIPGEPGRYIGLDPLYLEAQC